MKDKKSGFVERVECPPDTVYFLDPSQLEQSDLSALPIEKLIEVQGDINAMFALMHEHQVLSLPEKARKTMTALKSDK